MDTLQNNNNHIIKHEELLFTFEHMIKLINQMSGSQYHSLDIYINNCNHLHNHYLEAREILSYEGFDGYILKNDPQLYYNLQSMIISFKVISNMMNNLNEILKKSSSKRRV